MSLKISINRWETSLELFDRNGRRKQNLLKHASNTTRTYLYVMPGVSVTYGRRGTHIHQMDLNLIQDFATLHWIKWHRSLFVNFG